MASFADVPTSAVRAYWDARPCNVRHSPSPVGTREYFDEVEARKYKVEPHIRGFAQFERWRGKRVLEIGCGIGTDTINFARHGADVTAVDLSGESLRLARERARIFGLEDRISFFSADAEQLDRVVPVERYDLVYSFGVIHHTPNPERAIAAIRRYLGEDSVLKIMVYNRRSWKVGSILVTQGRGRVWRLDELVARHSEAQTGCPVTFVYSRSQVHRLLEGFRLDEVAVEHIFPYRIRDYVEYRYVKAWPFRALPEPAFEWVEHRLGWHLCVTASLPPGARAVP